MDIEIKGRFKSITDLEWKDIPKFSIITGPNGVGKSQLLELINLYFHHGNIPKGTYGDVEVIVNGLDLSHSQARILSSEWKFDNIQPTSISELQNRKLELYNQYIDFLRNPRLRRPYNTLQKFTEINEKLKKNYSEVSEEEFYELIDTYFIADEKQFIAEHISNIFFSYQIDFYEMKIKGYNDEQIINKIGQKPWLLINDVLKEADFPYEIHSPENISLTSKYNLKVVNTSSGEFIQIDQLSSGEKIILSLAFMLYNTTEKNVFPKLLLLDEPDAHLHPSLAKQFIDIVNNSFVEKYGIRVILTTHSPSTIAFAPDESIFEMYRDGERIRKSTSKNKSISILTSGIITVGDNSKFVLVEDVDDVNFYSFIFGELFMMGLINADIPIIFIPASNNERTGEDSGGKTVVEKWVKKLVEAGMENTLQGLIDLDDGNDEENNIHVIKRYSFENYLIDPVLIFGALVDNETGFTVPGIEIELGEEQKLLTISEVELQTIADKILSDIEPMVKGIEDNDKILEEIEYIDGRKIKLPKWFLYKKGKTLLNHFSTKFGHKNINPQSLFKMLRKLKIISNDFISIMINIQNNN